MSGKMEKAKQIQLRKELTLVLWKVLDCEELATRWIFQQVFKETSVLEELFNNAENLINYENN